MGSIERRCAGVNAESRQSADYVIERNCGKCCHNEVCQYKGAFDSVVKRAIHEVQGDGYLIEMNFKCKFHMYKGGTTYKFDNQRETHTKGGVE